MPEKNSSIISVESLKSAHAKILNTTEKRLYGRQGGRAIVKMLSSSVDTFLIDLWSQVGGSDHANVDLVAVGGYGRSELCPHSDWDILFLVAEGRNTNLNQRIQSFIQCIWDSGAVLGHAVRTPREAREFSKTDHHSRTALMESRLISGSGMLYKQLQNSIHPQHWSRKQRLEFCILKMEECKVRRRSQGGTAFVMEPDCKNGQGGLRDVSTIFWLAMGWYGVPKARELLRKGLVDEAEFSGFVSGRDFLWRVRSGLHFLAGRENDRLLFSYQTELATSFRYRDSEKSSAVERFLKNYFLNVRRIDDLTSLFLQHFEEEMSPPSRFSRRISLGRGMQLRKNQVGISDVSEFTADPLNLLSIFSLAQEKERYLDSKALRIIKKNAALVNSEVRNSREGNSIFLSILRSDRNVTAALSQMHETGILGQFCPEFKRITGHGQFDRYHHYTVDAHTIRAIDILRDFRIGSGQYIEMPLASQLMRELERPELLYVALLFHDIAKGRGGDHSVLGESLAKKFCKRLRLSSDDQEIVGWLVLHHLRLSKTAQHYDLTDQEVIADFSNFVGDRERLIYLFVLTVADVTAVGPGTWTEWKGHLFTQLFRASESYLRMGEAVPMDELERLRTRKKSVLKNTTSVEKKIVARMLDVFTNTLVMRYTPAFLLILCRLLRKESGVHLISNKEGGYTQILTWGIDRSRLFFELTSTLADANTIVLVAHAYALRDGRVLDEFQITDAKGVAITEKRQLERIQQRVIDAHSGAVHQVSQESMKFDVLMESVPVSVRYHEAAASSLSAVEVIAADRKGLLSLLAKAISDVGVSIRGANITTFGAQAVDVFFLSDQDGKKLDKSTLASVISSLESVAQLEKTYQTKLED